MAKNAVTDWDTSPGNNTDIAGININEGCSPDGINDAIRNMMSQVASWSTDILSGSPTFSGNPAFSGSPDFSGVANAATIRTDLGLEIGTNVQAQSAALADIAGITGAQGDLLYFNGTNWVALPKGTAGQSLTMNSGATAPEWVDAPRTVDPNMQPQSVTLTKDVIYQNNTGYIMPVVFRDTATVAGDMDVSDDGTTWTRVATINGSNTTEMGTFFVPPSWFYKCTVGNRSVIEWRA